MRPVCKARGKLGAVNRLAQETSPYLLQHADNPVDWYPWGEEALSRARDEDRPILLSIGYAACHWCHVMEHESFEDASTAAAMNERFVNVKVDREERPDLDAVYMEAVVALSGHGGWPMTVFLTPDGEPFYGGTYYPPEPRHGMPSFRQVLDSIAEAWRERRDDVSRAAAQLVEAVRHSAELRPSNDPLADFVLGAAERNLAATFEPTHGGWGRAPKFPNAPALEFLLRREGDAARAMVVKTLDEMAAGGMYDLLGGGFHRYSVDDRWLRAALREDALRQRAAGGGVSPRLAGDRHRPLPRDRWRDDRVHAARAAAARGRARVGTGRRHGRRRGAHVHLDRGGRARPPSCSSRSSTAARSSAASSTRRRVRRLLGDPRAAAEAVAGRQGDRVVERARARRARGGGPAARAGRTGSRRHAGSATSSSARSRERTEGCGAASATAARAGTGYLDDYANVAHGLLELHVATGELRWLREARRLARARGRALRGRAARRLLPLARRRRAAGRADEGARRPSASVRQLDARARAAPAGADLRRRRARAAGPSPCSGCSAPRSSGCRRRSAGGWSRSTCI